MHSDGLADDSLTSHFTPLGQLQRVRRDSTQLRGGTKHYGLTLVYPHQANGKIEQFLIDHKTNGYRGVCRKVTYLLPKRYPKSAVQVVQCC
jgi:hypothetical protein